MSNTADKRSNVEPVCYAFQLVIEFDNKKYFCLQSRLAAAQVMTTLTNSSNLILEGPGSREGKGANPPEPGPPKF